MPIPKFVTQVDAPSGVIATSPAKKPSGPTLRTRDDPLDHGQRAGGRLVRLALAVDHEREPVGPDRDPERVTGIVGWDDCELAHRAGRQHDRRVERRSVEQPAVAADGERVHRRCSPSLTMRTTFIVRASTMLKRGAFAFPTKILRRSLETASDVGLYGSLILATVRRSFHGDHLQRAARG